MIAAIAWWPWAWLAYNRYWQTGNFAWPILLGVAVSAQAMNHLPIFGLSAIWLACGALGYLPASRDALPTWLWRGTAGGLVTGVVLAGLTAGQLWPFMELFPFTQRMSLSGDEAAFGSLPPAVLLGLVFPPDLKFPEWFVFPGIGALLLALNSWSDNQARQRARWWIVAAGVGLILSLGPQTPLYGLLLSHIPGFQLLRVPARWWLFTVFALATLSAFAIEAWLRRALSRPVLKRTLAGLGALYAVAGAFNLVFPEILPFTIFPQVLMLPALTWILLRPPDRWKLQIIGLLLLIDAGWACSAMLRPAPEAELTATDHVLAAKLHADGLARSFAPFDGVSQSALVNFGLSAADGYDPIAFAAYARLVGAVSGCPYPGYAVTAPATQASADAREQCPVFEPRPALLRLLNVRYLIVSEASEYPDGNAAIAADDRLVYDLGPGLGPAFGVAQGETVSETACIDRLLSIDPAVVALTETSLPFDSAHTPPHVIASERDSNTARFEVRAEGPGLLVRSETWAPAWEAMVDGRPVNVLRVDCALQGVWLEDGLHQVVFEYRPHGYLIGRWISLASALLLAGGAVGAYAVRVGRHQVWRRGRNGSP